MTDASSHEPVLDSMRAAVQLTPDDPHLRAHLATMLLAASDAPEDAAEALIHSQRALGIVPDLLPALRAAAVAADRAGSLELSMSYWRLFDALAPGSDGDPGTASADDFRPVAPEERTDQDGKRPADELRAVPASGETGGSDGPPLIEAEVPTMGLDQVGGMHEVKQQLHTMFLGPLLNPALRELYGTSLRGGLLLYGPPGCGKTHIARGLAGELGTRFLHVGLPDVLDMWLGSSERNVHDLFESARQQAPTLVFLDELDVLGGSRSHLRSSPMRGVVAQLLVELDGVGDHNEGLFVLAATNQPWEVDPALRRPGRFDRMVFVAPPDPRARLEILRTHLETRPVERGLDLRRVVDRTEGFSGADLAAVVNGAAQLALTASIASGEARPITRGDIDESLQGRRSSAGPWFDVAKNVVTFANGSGEFDDLRDHLDRRRR